MHIIHRYEQMFHNHAYPEVVIFSASFQRFDDWMEVEDWESMELELVKGLCALHGARANLFEKLDRRG